MSIRQYYTHLRTFNVPYSIRPSNDPSIADIDETWKAVCLAAIDLPFKTLYAAISILLLVLNENIYTFLSMKYTLRNGLDSFI